MFNFNIIIKRILLLLFIILLVILPTTILKISNNKNHKNIYPQPIITIKKEESNIISTPKLEENPIGKIIIKKINLKQNLYNIESKENNVEKNVSILKESIPPDKDNSIMIIAAHSGTGKVAYFEELDKIQINDEIELIYKNKNYIYIVKNIWEDKKKGYINISKEQKKQLILTTCSPSKEGYQLIINCIEKES